MSHIRSKLFAYNAMPTSNMFTFKFSLDLICNISFICLILHCLQGYVLSICLHILIHICKFHCWFFRLIVCSRAFFRHCSPFLLICSYLFLFNNFSIYFLQNLSFILMSNLPRNKNQMCIILSVFLSKKLFFSRISFIFSY